MPGLWAEPQEQAETLTICLADPVSKVEAELSYTVFAETDVIARSVKLVKMCIRDSGLSGAHAGAGACKI